MFIDPKADTIYTQIDERALAVMKKSGVPIVPVLSNNYKTEFLGEPVHRILTDPRKKERLINDVINILQKNQFTGVNVDLEELQEKTDEPLIAFQKRALYPAARKRIAGNPGHCALQYRLQF